MTNLHNSLHNYCTTPILPEMNPIQQAIIKHLYKWAGTIGSIVYRDLAADFPDKSRRTFYYHLKILKDMGLVEETSLTKPFPLQLNWTGRQCVQLGSARVTDRSWVRLEKFCLQCGTSLIIDYSDTDEDRLFLKITQSEKLRKLILDLLTEVKEENQEEDE